MSKIIFKDYLLKNQNILQTSPINAVNNIKTLETNRHICLSTDRFNKKILIQKTPINNNNLIKRKVDKSFDDYKTFTQKDIKKKLYSFKAIKVKKNREYNILNISDIDKNKQEKDQNSFLYKNDFLKTCKNEKIFDEIKDINANGNINNNTEEKKSNDTKHSLYSIKKTNINGGEVEKSTIDKLKQKLKTLTNKSMRYKKHIIETKLMNKDIENKIKVVKNTKKKLKIEEKNLNKLNNKIETLENELSSKTKIIKELENNKNIIEDNLSQLKTDDTNEDCNYEELLNEINNKNNEINKKINISKKKLNKVSKENSILKTKYENKINNIKEQIIDLSHNINIIDNTTHQEKINKYYKQCDNLLNENHSLKDQLITTKDLKQKMENLEKLNENYLKKINILKKVNFRNISLDHSINTITDNSNDLSNCMSNDCSNDDSMDYSNGKSDTRKIKKRKKKSMKIKNIKKVKKSFEQPKSKNSSFDKTKRSSISKEKRKKNNLLKKNKNSSFLFTISNKGVLISFDIENNKYSIIHSENIEGWEFFINEYLSYFEGSLCLNTCDGLLIVTGENYNDLYFYSQKNENISKIRTFEYKYKYGGIIITPENNLIILGGCDNTHVELLNIEENQESSLSCLLTERINSSYSYIGNILCALFGKNNDTIEYLDMNNMDSNWNLINYTTNLGNNMKINLDGHASIPINNNEIIIIGGSKNDKILVFNFMSKFVEVTNVNIPLIESAGEYRFDKDKYFNLIEKNNIDKDDSNENVSQLVGMDSKGNIHSFDNNFSYIVFLIKDINK